MGILFELKSISKSYPTTDGRALCILNDLSFSLPNKGMFFIYGKSGCGKSTLLNIFEGLMKPTKGEVLYKGKNVSKFNEKELNNYLKNEIGVVFQSFNLLSEMTTKENLELASKIKGIKGKEKIEELLKRYNIYDLKNKKVSLLSGGEKQRVCLVRAAINNPNVIFADEPTGNLDKENSLVIMNDLKEISKKCLVVVVSHNKKIVEEFNDGFLDLTDGNQSNFKGISNQDEEIPSEKKKTCYQSFIPLMLGKNLLKNFGKNFVALFSIFFSIVVLLISLGFSNGVKNNTINLFKDYQNYNSFRISKVLYETVNDSNLTLLKTEKPDLKDINQNLSKYKNIEIHDNIDYFFGETKEVKINNVFLDGVSFVPTNNMQTSNVVYVNEAFSKLYKKKLSKESCIKEKINLHLKRSYFYENKSNVGSNIIKEDFMIYIPFFIEEVKDEFSYLNYPKVYFSISYFEKFIDSLLCNNIFKNTGEKISYLELLRKAEKNSELGSFSYLVFLDSKEDSLNLCKDKENINGLKIDNDPYTIVRSFEDLSSSLSNGFIFFIFISIGCSIALVSFLSFSSFILNRKQSAILSIEGAKNNEIFLVYILEQIAIGIVGVVLSFSTIKYITIFINNIILKYTKFANLIEIPINYRMDLLISLLCLALIFVFVALPLVLSKRREIYKELKEE